SIVFCEAPEVGEDAQAQFLALFRMELAREETVGGNARSERGPVVRSRCDNRAVVRSDVEGMDEINVIAARDTVEKRRVAPFVDAVPAHMRYFKIFPRAKPENASRKKIEAFLRAELFAFRKQKLKAQANAEK